MSMKEFTARCSAITLITASAFGIAHSAQPQVAHPASATESRAPTYSAAIDDTISVQVTSALSTNNIGGVRIETQQGIVLLSGTVASEESRLNAARIAAAVDGVRGVDIAALEIRPKG